HRGARADPGGHVPGDRHRVRRRPRRGARGRARVDPAGADALARVRLHRRVRGPADRQRRGGPGRVPALLRRAVPLVDVAAARPDRDRLVPHGRHLQPGLVHARGDPLPVHHRLGRRGAGAGIRLRGRRGGHRDRGVLLRAPDADGAHVSRGSFRSVARALAWRNVHNWFTNPTLILPGVLFPMFFFTAFAGGLSRVASIPGFDYDANYTTWIYGFV